MSGVEEVAVVLEHDIDEQYQYQPGETLRGQVRVRVHRPTALRTVLIRVVGEGTVSWKDEDDHSVNQAEEKYVDSSQPVLDARNSDPTNLSPGTHHFPFDYTLPENLPSSYIGKYGNVTYTMKATVTGVNSVDAAITSEPFLVLRRSALPQQVEEAVNLEMDKRLWGSCSFGKLSARLALEAWGGVPGQDLFMHSEVKNQSKRTVTAMQAALIMVSTYHARHKSVSFRQMVAKKRDEMEVEHNEGRRWNYVRLTLPPYIPETRLEYCDIIDITYVFQFRVEVTGGAELKMETPVRIGSHFQSQGGNPSRNPNQPRGLVNRQWSVGVGPGMNFSDLDAKYLEEEDGMHNPWGAASGVPEMRGDKVISNPLFQHGLPPARMQPVPNIPEEHMENTRL